MAYNTGLYVSVAKFLRELVNAGRLEAKSVVLSAKTLIAGNEYSFTFSPATPAPAVGDFLIQGDFAALITNVTGTVLRADDATGIVNGKAKAVIYDGNLSDLEVYIKEAMAFIDRHTRQWFNARTFDDTKPVLMEGNNTETLFFPVPILEITTLKKQKDSEILAADDYQVFNGRSFPDDRRNPMLKLRRDSDDVMFIGTGKFMRGVRAIITGIFGFLEEDGSTPLMIQRATLKLSLMYYMRTLGESAEVAANSAELGPIKREKTDMHEIEYFDARATGGKDSSASGSGLSGDDEVDDIIAAYKGPIVIGGTFPDIGIEAPELTSFGGGVY